MTTTVDFDAITRRAINYSRPTREEVVMPEPANPDDLDLASWLPVDLAEVIASGYTSPTPGLLRFRESTVGLIYAGLVNGIHGDSGTGKSWVAMAAAAQEIMAGRHVCYLDFEANAGEVVARLVALGCTTDQLVGHLDYVRPDVSAGYGTVTEIIERIEDTETVLVVIDSLGEAFGVWGVNEDRDDEVGPWIRNFARRIADAGPAVLMIDHSTKARERPLFASGSKRKRAAVTGSSFLVEATVSPTRDTPGRLTLTCAKDRHGTYAQGERVASIEVTPYPDGGVTVNVWPIETTTAGVDNTTKLIARALVKWLDELGRPASKAEMEASGAVKASRNAMRAGLDYAEAEGAVTVAKGARHAHLYTWQHNIEIAP